jgi:hypothetical protein
MLFGPDGALYVTSSVQSGNGGNLIAEQGTSQVLRYDGSTGAFLSTFVTPDSGGLRNPSFLAFTETNPTTLQYDGGMTSTTSGMLLAQPAGGTRAASTASQPPGGSDFDPAAVAVSLLIAQPPAAPAGTPNPALALSHTRTR